MPTRTRQKPSLTTSFSSAEPATIDQAHSINPKPHNLTGDIAFIENEFHKLLRKSRFVARVIEIHLNNETRLSNQTTSSTDSHRDCRAEERNGAEWQGLIERNLPQWLFWVTTVLMMQAKMAAEDRPMSRAQLAELLNDRLFRQASNDLLFKTHRKRIWTPAVLRSAVHSALKDINNPGAVTLENLAKRITVRARNSSPLNLMKPLSGKHLQKLLQGNDIDWIEIKRSYKERLLTRVLKR